jgi:hypothetical protein
MYLLHKLIFLLKYMYLQWQFYKFFNNKIYNINGQVVKALAYNAEDQSSNLL